MSKSYINTPDEPLHGWEPCSLLWENSPGSIQCCMKPGFSAYDLLYLFVCFPILLKQLPYYAICCRTYVTEIWKQTCILHPVVDDVTG